jgi:hypothetical protein
MARRVLVGNLDGQQIQPHMKGGWFHWGVVRIWSNLGNLWAFLSGSWVFSKRGSGF